MGGGREVSEQSLDVPSELSIWVYEAPLCRREPRRKKRGRGDGPGTLGSCPSSINAKEEPARKQISSGPWI